MVCYFCVNDDKDVDVIYFCKICEVLELLCEMCVKEYIWYKMVKNYEICINMIEFLIV